jgi:hypothetical protein
LEWVELYKSDVVQDISLAQWLALTAAGIVASSMNVSEKFVRGLKKEKQLLLKGTGESNAGEAFPPLSQSVGVFVAGVGWALLNLTML